MRKKLMIKILWSNFFSFYNTLGTNLSRCFSIKQSKLKQKYGNKMCVKATASNETYHE